MTADHQPTTPTASDKSVTTRKPRAAKSATARGLWIGGPNDKLVHPQPAGSPEAEWRF